jgi:hypothetical protein
MGNLMIHETRRKLINVDRRTRSNRGWVSTLFWYLVVGIYTKNFIMPFKRKPKTKAARARSPAPKRGKSKTPQKPPAKPPVAADDAEDDDDVSTQIEGESDNEEEGERKSESDSEQSVILADAIWCTHVPYKVEETDAYDPKKKKMVTAYCINSAVVEKVRCSAFHVRPQQQLW